MDYESMKVAELRSLAKDWGVKLPKNATKDYIISVLYANEPVEVEAEVVEPDEGLAIRFNAGEITANFDALEARVDEILADYDGWEPSPENLDDVAQCAQHRKYLNGLAKQLDERRKAVKNQYLAPLNAFEAKANGIRDKIKDVSGRLKAVEDEADNFRRGEKKQELMDCYEACAGVLVDMVPYEKIHDERWLNKTYSLKCAMDEIENRVISISSDWKMLKSLNLEYQADAEALFFDTLDVSKAIEWAQKLSEDKRKIEAMKSEVEQVYSAPYEPTPEDRKRTAIADISQMLEWYDLNKLENIRTALEKSRIVTGEGTPRVMCIDSATDGQLDVIGKFCGLVGVTGVFKQGTLDDVMKRSMYGR